MQGNTVRINENCEKARHSQAQGSCVPKAVSSASV